ncbi:MAG TPA: SDR family oxidoreductase [Anaerolineae bacterium]|nr:SDR family oxidoreductase [Anaerolineae bacterium]
MASNDLFDLRGRVVIITGGLGQLGRQFSRAIAERGGRVAIFDINPNGAAIVETMGEQTTKDSFLFASVDVTQRASVEAGLSQVIEKWGVPYALVNNAALDSPPNAPAEENGPFETYPDASWNRVLDVNVTGVFHCCQVIGGKMAKEGRGSIINICSIYGIVSPDQRIYEYRRQAGAPFFKPVAYSVSKSALLNLTRYLATYWAPRNVRVNTLTFAGVFNNQDQEFLKLYIPKVPLGRMAREDEYNGAVVFLISDASSYMTGANLVFDGGFTAW